MLMKFNENETYPIARFWANIMTKEERKSFNNDWEGTKNSFQREIH